MFKFVTSPYMGRPSDRQSLPDQTCQATSDAAAPQSTDNHNTKDTSGLKLEKASKSNWFGRMKYNFTSAGDYKLRMRVVDRSQKQHDYSAQVAADVDTLADDAVNTKAICERLIEGLKTAKTSAMLEDILYRHVGLGCELAELISDAEKLSTLEQVVALEQKLNHCVQKTTSHFKGQRSVNRQLARNLSDCAICMNNLKAAMRATQANATHAGGAVTGSDAENDKAFVKSKTDHRTDGVMHIESAASENGTVPRNVLITDDSAVERTDSDPMQSSAAISDNKNGAVTSSADHAVTGILVIQAKTTDVEMQTAAAVAPTQVVDADAAIQICDGAITGKDICQFLLESIEELLQDVATNSRYRYLKSILEYCKLITKGLLDNDAKVPAKISIKQLIQSLDTALVRTMILGTHGKKVAVKLREDIALAEFLSDNALQDIMTQQFDIREARDTLVCNMQKLIYYEKIIRKFDTDYADGIRDMSNNMKLLGQNLHKITPLDRLETVAYANDTLDKIIEGATTIIKKNTLGILRAKLQTILEVFNRDAQDGRFCDNLEFRLLRNLLNLTSMTENDITVFVQNLDNILHYVRKLIDQNLNTTSQVMRGKLEEMENNLKMCEEEFLTQCLSQSILDTRSIRNECRNLTNELYAMIGADNTISVKYANYMKEELQTLKNAQKVLSTTTTDEVEELKLAIMVRRNLVLLGKKVSNYLG